MRFDLPVLDIFGSARCTVVAGETLADAWALARAAWPNIDKSHDPGDEACTIEVDDRAVVLVARDVDVATFAHEALHVAAWVLRSRDMPFSYENEEGVAYLLGWVMRHAWPPVTAWRAVAGTVARPRTRGGPPAGAGPGRRPDGTTAPPAPTRSRSSSR